MQLNSKFRSLTGLILLVVLMLPSAFFLLRVAPLWRDSDGFYQLADRPNILQILHWPPLYCFLARIPLVIGDLAAPLFLGRPTPSTSFDNPAFTPIGLLFLVFFQHALLVASLLVAVWKLCCTTVTRLAFALLLVSQPWLYAFAHCVGSEAFSHPLILITAVATVVWIRQPKPNKQATIFLLVSMFASMLSRQINIVLALLPPVSLLLVQLTRRALPIRPASERCRAAAQPAAATRQPCGRRSGADCERRGVSPKLSFAPLLHAALIGGIAILGSTILTLGLCAWYKVPYRSRMGYSFQWRLDYLGTLSGKDREQRLSSVERALSDQAISYGIHKLGESFTGEQGWQPEALSQAIFEWVRQRTDLPFRKQAYEMDVRLNRIARWFLLSGDTTLYLRIATDSVRTLLFSPAELAREPFRATDYLHGMLNQPSFERLRGLASFHVPFGTYDSEWQNLWYYHLWQSWPICLFGIASFAVSGIHLLIRPRSATAADGLALSIAFSGVAAGFAILNCSVTWVLPRYSAPSCILLLVAFGQAFARLHLGLSNRDDVV